ncbi:MAG: hypothetical protein P8J87_04690 [Verrucomicrobiales bacterium]|nr:hypothetical protein [Verrucomicrobiales bacterium]
MLVNVDIQNVGDPLGVPFGGEVVLSRDFYPGATDPVIANPIVTDANLGLRTVNVLIPPTLGTGNWYWGLVVDSTHDETCGTNNHVLGGMVTLLHTDLQLEEPAPLHAFARISDVGEPSALVRVNNVGAPESILTFSVELRSPAPWLTFDPPTGASVGGADGIDVTLTFHQNLVPLGTYNTTLRFQNWLIPDDFQDLQVSLTVGEAYFWPGHQFEGQIASAADIDLIKFSGIPGMKLTLRAKSTSGNIRPRFSIINPAGIVEKVVTFKHSGQYLNKNVKSPLVGGSAIKVLVLSGAVLEFRLHPNAQFTGSLGCAVTTVWYQMGWRLDGMYSPVYVKWAEIEVGR